jgi:hypothetical protein
MIYKGGQGPPQNITSTPKAIQTTIQDVGYYAHRGPNLSKPCVPSTFKFLISASPYLKLTTSGIPLGVQAVKHQQLAGQVGVHIEDPPANSMASFKFTSVVPPQGTTFVFGLWVCVADGAGSFCGRTNLNYTGSSTRVHISGLRRASNGIILWPVG